MNFFLSILLFIISIITSSSSITRINARQDTERKTDINTLYAKLEEHYSVNNGYPTLEEVIEEYDQNLPGLTEGALYDPEGIFINKGDYLYAPSSCTAIDCAHYNLKATLSDGSTYEKNSMH